MPSVFHDPATWIAKAKARGQVPNSVGVDEFYNDLQDKFPQFGTKIQDCVARMWLQSECNWIKTGRPRYKLHDAYAQMLIDSPMRVPCEIVNFPHLDFVVSLPVSSDSLLRAAWEGDAKPVGSLLIGSCPGGEGVAACWAMMVAAYHIDGEYSGPIGFVEGHSGQTVEEALANSSTHSVAVGCEHDFGFMVRLAVGVLLLATSVHRCVQHDVIEALRDRYKHATTDSERKRIEELSERRSGRREWTIGRDLKLYTSAYNDAPDSDGQQLRYQHIRGGHFHTVAYGTGKRQRKVEWFEPTIVRPDLPLKPISA